MDNEKRGGRRHTSITEISFDHIGLHFQGRISDLSPGGFFVDTINPLPVNSVLTFRFVLPGDASEIAISGEGRVVWLQPMQGMGVRFTKLSDVDQHRLQSYLSRT